MRITYPIFGILATMFLVSGCSFWWADPGYYKYKKLANKYGSFYIFNKNLAGEMKQREMERGEFDKKS